MEDKKVCCDQNVEDVRRILDLQKLDDDRNLK